MSTLPLSPIHPQAQPEEKKMDYFGVKGKGAGGCVQVKDRRKSWKKFNVRTMKMGIFREEMNP